MIAGACWDFIVRHGFVLPSSLFILQLVQSWKHTYAEKPHVLNKIPFLEKFLLFLGPRKTHFSAQRWNKIASYQLIQQWPEGKLPWWLLLCFSSPWPSSVPCSAACASPQQQLGGCQDPLVSRSKMSWSDTSRTHWQNLKSLGVWCLEEGCVLLLFDFILLFIIYYLKFKGVLSISKLQS